MPPPSSLPWTGPRTPPRGSEPPGGCRLTTGAEPGIASLDEPGSALFACRPKGRFRQTVRPGATRETAGRMKRLPRPGLASLEWSSLAADTGTFGAGRPEGHSAQDGCFCAGSPTTSILTNGRARQSLVYRFVRRQAGAPTVASSRTASSTKPRKPKKTGSCDRFQQEPSQDRGSGRARRKTADAPRRPETGERRARFPIRRKHARRNEPGPVAMGRGRSRTGGRARFSASISCRNGSPAACRRPVFREVSLPQ